MDVGTEKEGYRAGGPVVVVACWEYEMDQVAQERGIWGSDTDEIDGGM